MNSPTAAMDGVVDPWGEIGIVTDGGTYTFEMEGDQLVGRYLEVGADSRAKAVTLTSHRQGRNDEGRAAWPAPRVKRNC